MASMSLLQKGTEGDQIQKAWLAKPLNRVLVSLLPMLIEHLRDICGMKDD